MAKNITLELTPEEFEYISNCVRLDLCDLEYLKRDRHAPSHAHFIAQSLMLIEFNRKLKVPNEETN